MAHIELIKSNFFHNLKLLCKRAGGVESLAVVLKDNAYGHGLLEMAKLSNEFGIKKAVVRDEKEAGLIVGEFDLVLLLIPSFEKFDDRFSYTINSMQHLLKAPKGAKIHLKIDSGMHRNGIDESDIEDAFSHIVKNGLVLEGVMTHFRSADDLNSELFWQMKNWKKIKAKVLEMVQKYHLQRPLFHSFASSALLRMEMEDDFARCGISIYGYSELDSSFGSFELKPVLKLKADQISSRFLRKGQRVGYGGVGKVESDSIVSSYDLGYGDGLFRYDGRGDLMISESRVLGRISMDSFMLEGALKEVEVFGDAKYFANYFNTIVYDVLVKLSPRISKSIIK